MTSARSLIVAVRGAIALALLAPFWFWRGGVLELEILQFIQQYLDGRSVLRKVFDPYGNDFRTYQAREFSYFLDFLDARIFARLMAADVMLFIPATAVLASLLTVIVFVAAVRRYTAIPPLTAGLLLLLYVSNYVFLVTAGMFYRSTKPLLAPVLMATAFFLASRFGATTPPAPPERGGIGWRAATACWALFCVMSLLDRQGFFYAVVGWVLLAGAAVVWRRGWDLVCAGLVAVACMTAYNIWIGPAIVEAVNGYRPSLEYQEVPPDALVAGLDVYRQSIDVLLDGVRVLLGSVSRVMAALLLGAVVAVGLVRSRRWPMATAALAILAVSHIVMFAVMIVRHPPLYEWLDHRFWYYPLPTQALLLALLVMLLNRAMADWARWRVMVLNLTLTAAVVSNVAHWTDYRDLMLTSRWFSRVYPQTQMLRDSLREGVPDPGLIRQYRQFYDFCLTLSPGLSERAAAAGTSPRP